MAVSRPGWGAVVQGEPTDLKKWANALKEPFDPWVEIHQGEMVLRSEALDKLTSAGEVYDRAPDLIARLNGAIALSQSTSHPILFTGNIVSFAHDSTMHRALMAGSGQLRLHGESALVIHDDLVAVVGPNGKPRSPPPPQPSEVHHWIKVVERDPSLVAPFVYFGKGANWPDIYKALECLFERVGGERAFLALNWEPEKEVKRLKQTANWERKWARHAKPKGKPPKNPMGLEDGHALLGRLLRRALG
jgi:hypothetical protein